MKKGITCLLLILLTLSVFSGCDAKRSEILTGHYQCISAEYSGTTYMSLENHWLELSSNGVGILCTAGYEVPIHWSKDDDNKITVFITANNETSGPYYAAVVKGNIAFEYLGVSYVFSQNGKPVEMLDETSFSTIKSTTDALTLEEASEHGGYYIKRGEMFYPLTSGTFISPRFWQEDNFVAVTDADTPIPRITGDDELVLFSSLTTESVAVRQVALDGYTIPVFFAIEDDDVVVPYVSSQQIFENRDNLSRYFSDESNLNDVKSFFELLERGEVTIAWNEDYEIEIHGEFDDHEIYIGSYEDDYTYKESIGVGFAPDTQVTLGYYVGSAYNEITIPVCLCYWTAFDYTEWNVLPFMFIHTQSTRLGYYTLDISDFERGTYIIYANTYNDGSGYWTDAGFDDYGVYYDSALVFSVE